MRKLLFAVLLVAAAATVTVPRLGDGDDLVLAAPDGTDAADVERTLQARLADAGLTDVDVSRDGRRFAFSPVDGSTRDLVRALGSAYRLHVRPVDGTCDAATKPDRTDPTEPVDLPVRPPADPACLRLGAAVAGNDAIERAQASGTHVVIRFVDIPLATRSQWAIEVDGEVLSAPRVAESGESWVELVVDAQTTQSALALAAGLAHPLPGDLV